MTNSIPLYIVSKGRADSRLTSKALESMNVPYFIVIEKQEYPAYSAVIDSKKILILDPKYQEQYETCDNLGDTKSKGPGAARNFVWDHSINEGHKWHWVMDDNIRRFVRYNKNEQLTVKSDKIFRAMEDFVQRYTNISMAGPNYFMFIPRKSGSKKHPPFVKNTRIYSCNLIRNDVPYRWRGRYNEDTDLSLRMLKDKWCTIQFNAFLQEKMTTQLIKGGNTKEFYANEGTYAKSQMQVQLHPDVSRLAWRFGRIHHYVDYNPFKKTKLHKKKDVAIPSAPNEYGMVRIELKDEKDAQANYKTSRASPDAGNHRHAT
jgi:hypothetical protein